MLNQRGYGRIDNIPIGKNDGSTYGECKRCKVQFILEKPHKTIKTFTQFWARKKEGTLTPSKETEVAINRLCLSCHVEFLKWLEKK